MNALPITTSHVIDSFLDRACIIEDAHYLQGTLESARPGVIETCKRLNNAASALKNAGTHLDYNEMNDIIVAHFPVGRSR